VPQYRTATFSIGEVSIDSSLFGTQTHIKEFKYLQTSDLIEEFSRQDVEWFSPQEVHLLDGMSTIITPPIVEMSGSESHLTIIEGHARAYHCWRLGRRSFMAVIADKVDAHMPTVPSPFSSITVASRTLRRNIQFKDLDSRLWRPVEKCMHPIDLPATRAFTGNSNAILVNEIAEPARTGMAYQETIGDDTYRNVRSCLDGGDYVSAVNGLLAGFRFVDSDAQTCIEVISICQKHGALSKAVHYVEELRQSEKKKNWEPFQRVLADVVEYKIHSQQHNFDTVLERCDELCRDLQSVRRENLVPGILRRAALGHAIKGNLTEAFAELTEAQKLSTELHDLTTSKVYEAMIKGIASKSNRALNEIEVLVTAQSVYLRTPLARSNFQANPFKSALQSLFAEAAVMLAHNRNTYMGMVRLAAAHLLGPKAHTNPFMEGYAELLALIGLRSSEQERMFREAMCSDEQDRAKFQANYPNCAHHIQLCNSVPTLMQGGGSDAWDSLRALLSDIDAFHRGKQE